jgi:hypothetical protein
MGYQSPLADSLPKWSSTFIYSFLQAAVGGPILGIDFLRKFRITVTPVNSQFMLGCMATAQPAAEPSLPSFLSTQLDHPHHREQLHRLQHCWQGKHRWTHFSLTVRVTGYVVEPLLCHILSVVGIIPVVI